jgi:glycosyltransferase involved in cell wall biosynthesis
MYNSDIGSQCTRREGNLEIVEIPFTNRYSTGNLRDRSKRFGSFCNVIFTYFRIICLSNADYYHAHNAVVGWIVYLSCITHRGNFIYDCHEILWTEGGFSTRGIVILEKILLMKAELALCPSEPRAQLIQDHYGLKDKPVSIYNYPSFRKSISQDKNRMREELKLSNDELILFYSGMLAIKTRLQDQIIRALPLLPPEVVFVIVGYGHEGEISLLRELSKKNNVEDRVFIRPPKPHKELIDFTSGADIGVALLKDCGPGYQYHALNKFYEYVASGLAVVASNFKSFRDDVYDNPVGQIGYTCSEEDPVSISEAISLFVNNRKLLDRCKMNSTILYEKYWNWETQGKKLLRAYESVGHVRMKGYSGEIPAEVH